MNILKNILERLNQKLDASNIFGSIYGLAEQAPDNPKQFFVYEGSGQGKPVTDYDKTQGTAFWRLRSAVTMRQTEVLRPIGCQEMYIATYPLRCYAYVKKNSLPCDSNAVEGWVMDMFWKYVAGKDTALRTNLGVTDIFFRPVSTTPNTPDLPANFEFVHLYFDLDVEVTAKAIESCYDECGVNPIPLPNGQCPPINRVQSVTGLDTDNTDPSNPIVRISVDGITITGAGTPDDPLVSSGGTGGVTVTTQDEGVTVAAVTTNLNFTGAGVTASLASPGNVTVNIPASSGGDVDSVNGQTGTVVLDTDDISDTATNRYTNDTDIARLANTSGTNTGDQDLSGLALKTTTISTNSPLSGGGDLSANRTLSIPQANGSTDGYLDSADWNTFNGKQDTVTAGTGISIASNVITNTAPDQTVVLNEGTGIGVTGTYPNFTITNTRPAYILFKNVDNQTAVTGNTNNNLVLGVSIPANTIAVGSIVNIKARVGKTGGAGITTLRVYANTANSIVSPAPTLLMTSSTVAISQTYNSIDRNAIVKSATVTQTAQANASIQTDATVGNATLTNSNIDWTVDQFLIFAIQNGANGDSTVLSYIEIEIK